MSSSLSLEASDPASSATHVYGLCIKHDYPKDHGSQAPNARRSHAGVRNLPNFPKHHLSPIYELGTLHILLTPLLLSLQSTSSSLIPFLLSHSISNKLCGNTSIASQRQKIHFPPTHLKQIDYYYIRGEQHL